MSNNISGIGNSVTVALTAKVTLGWLFYPDLLLINKRNGVKCLCDEKFYGSIISTLEIVCKINTVDGNEPIIWLKFLLGNIVVSDLIIDTSNKSLPQF